MFRPSSFVKNNIRIICEHFHAFKGQVTVSRFLIIFALIPVPVTQCKIVVLSKLKFALYLFVF